MPELKLPIIEEEDLDNLTDLEPRSDDPNEDRRPDVPSEINILPLRDSVIYPMLIAPLSVARESSVQLIDESIVGTNRVIGVVAQRRPQDETPGFDDVFDYGCAVIIRTLVKMPDAVRLIVQGVTRFRIVERLQETPYLRARIEVLDEEAVPEGREEELEALKRSVAALFDHADRRSPGLHDELRSLTPAVQDSDVMADLVAAHMTLPVEDKQKVLETHLGDRLRALLEMLGREVRVLELTSKVQSEVNTEEAQQDPARLLPARAAQGDQRGARRLRRPGRGAGRARAPGRRRTPGRGEGGRPRVRPPAPHEPRFPRVPSRGPTSTRWRPCRGTRPPKTFWICRRRS